MSDQLSLGEQNGVFRRKERLMKRAHEPTLKIATLHGRTLKDIKLEFFRWRTESVYLLKAVKAHWLLEADVYDPTNVGHIDLVDPYRIGNEPPLPHRFQVLTIVEIMEPL